ncbi:hypothetical protein GpartN1_g1787.t1 [Galdieria partita]|uniref:Uncharacterized protein n=1 Tax=Galdieria partita TaxID=83374 RepID=A0A9C7PT89_9RHOD|nr:hypothetical protein GpartN1_g1787.t1 [Galdieria partita]
MFLIFHQVGNSYSGNRNKHCKCQYCKVYCYRVLLSRHLLKWNNCRRNVVFTSCANTSLYSWTFVAQQGGSNNSSKAKSGRTPKNSKKSTSKSAKSGELENNSNLSKDKKQELTTPSASSRRQGVGLNDIPVDLGEVISDPLLEENEVTELPTDENSWRHAVEYALEEIHSQVKYSKSQFSWMKPFTNTSKNSLLCERCEGIGMMTCEYCHGQGFVRFGPGNNFRIRYRQIEVVLPRRVWGDLYYCPVCGGLRRERCISCCGSGIVQNTTSIPTEEERLESLKKQQVPKRGKHRIYFLRDINKEMEEKLQQHEKQQRQRPSSNEEDIDFLD